MNKYFCYRCVRLDNNTPFYIGIGSKPKTFVTYYTEYYRAFIKNKSSYYNHILNSVDCLIEVIYESNDRHEIENKEKEFIKLYGRIDVGSGTLVNLTDGGKVDTKISHITKQKWKGRNKGRAPWNKNRTGVYTKDQLDRITQANRINALNKPKKPKPPKLEKKPRKLSADTIAKRQKTWRERGHNNRKPEHIRKVAMANRKPIAQYDFNGNKIAEFSSLKEAVTLLGLSYIGALSNHIRGRRKSFMGYVWKYINDGDYFTYTKKSATKGVVAERDLCGID